MCLEGNKERRDVNNNVPKQHTHSQDIDCKSDYYQSVIRQMLLPGHESELIYWLKSAGMLLDDWKCHDKPMTWTPFASRDLYVWKCGKCTGKKSIRSRSSFEHIKCSFNETMRLLLAWTKSLDCQAMSEILNVKPNQVCQVYNKAGNLAEEYIDKHLDEFQLGGSNQIVLIQVYTNPNNRLTRPILCLTEVKSLPQKVWYQALEKPRNTRQVQNQNKIINTIKRIAKPHSTLVFANNQKYDTIVAQLRDSYPLILYQNDLERHNTKEETCQSIFDTIWQRAHYICDAAQTYNTVSLAQQFLLSEMWQRRFEEQAYEVLLHQLARH